MLAAVGDMLYAVPAVHDDGAHMPVGAVGIVVHACRRGGVGPGKKVAILGAGPIGALPSIAVTSLVTVHTLRAVCNATPALYTALLWQLFLLSCDEPIDACALCSNLEAILCSADFVMRLLLHLLPLSLQQMRAV